VRGGRFSLTAYLSRKFGPEMQKRIEKNLLLWTSVVIVIAVAALWLIHLIS
jgi:hypothetical protein